MFKRWIDGIAQGLVVCLAWAAMTYLAHIHSPWTTPLLEGAGGATFALATIVGIKILRWLPSKRVIPSVKNIESCVRQWLDNYKVTVKKDSIPTAHFCLRITLDGGTQMTILRNKDEYSEYILVVADLGIRGKDKTLLEVFTDEEINQVLLDLKMELARARVGYEGLVSPPENFHVFRRVPIHSNLSEFAFMSAIGEVEAAFNIVLLTFAMAKQRADKRTEAAQLPPMLPK